MSHVAHSVNAIEAPSAPPRPGALVRGNGWAVTEYICNLGPRDRPYEEQHEQVAVSAVVEGSFEYRSTQGRALLYPGSFLLGDIGTRFECGHQHVRGDRCIAFRFDSWFFEEVAAAAAGAQRFRFRAPMLPAQRALSALVIDAEAALANRNIEALEDLAIRMAERAIGVVSGATSSRGGLNSKDARRIGEVLHYIEAHAADAIDLDSLASLVYMSKYHFLRVFRRVTGVTPHQFLLGLRLRRAALALDDTPASISTVALEAGFGDLSTFNAHFRGMFGVSPSAFRARNAKVSTLD